MPSQRVLPRSFWRCDCQQSGLVPSRVNRELVTDPGLFPPVRGPMTAFRAMTKIVQPQFDIAAEFARRDDVVVLASSLALGARIARDKFRRRVAGEPGTACHRHGSSPPQYGAAARGLRRPARGCAIERLGGRQRPIGGRRR